MLKNCWEKQQKLANLWQKKYFKNKLKHSKRFDHVTDDIMSLFWSWKNLSSRTLPSRKFSLPCDKRVSLRTADVFPFVVSLPTKNNQSGRFLNLETVVTSWSYCSRGKWRIRPEFTVSRISGIFRRLFMRHTNFLKVLRIGSRIGSALWNIQHILWLISPFKQHDEGEILVSFQGRWTSIYYFFDSQIFNEVLDIFPRLSYRLTFIMLNVGMVDNLEFW